MLDSDLAEIYQVETRILNQTVKRNIKRFPSEFMFRLSKVEFENLNTQVLISQIVTSKESRGGRRKIPFVFTEQGVSMLSTVLRSKVAIDESVLQLFTKRGKNVNLSIYTKNISKVLTQDIEKHNQQNIWYQVLNMIIHIKSPVVFQKY